MQERHRNNIDQETEGQCTLTETKTDFNSFHCVSP